MTSVNTSRSRNIPRQWQSITGVGEQRLPVGGLGPERIASDAVGWPIHLTADEPMGPQARDGERVSKQAGRAGLIRSPQVEKTPLGPSGRVEVRLPGEWAALRRAIQPWAARRGPNAGEGAFSQILAASFLWFVKKLVKTMCCDEKTSAKPLRTEKKEVDLL